MVRQILGSFLERTINNNPKHKPIELTESERLRQIAEVANWGAKILGETDPKCLSVGAVDAINAAIKRFRLIEQVALTQGLR